MAMWTHKVVVEESMEGAFQVFANALGYETHSDGKIEARGKWGDFDSGYNSLSEYITAVDKIAKVFKLNIQLENK